MARQGTIGGKKDRLLTNNLIINSKENTQLSAKLASLEIQQRKEMVRWEREKKQLTLPSIKPNCERISLTPPPSPTTSPFPSPVLQRRGSDILAAAPAARSHLSTGIGSDVVGLRRSKSSQNIRLSAGPQPPRGVGSASPKLLHRRSTTGQVSLHDEGQMPKQTDAGRRFSAGVVPSIRVEDSSETLNEKVKKFNESLHKFSKGTDQDVNDANAAVDDRPPSEELLIPQRTLAHRWKSLPSIFPVSVCEEKSSEEMTFFEDMKRCRYLRIPDLPALSIEQIFDNEKKQTAKK